MSSIPAKRRSSHLNKSCRLDPICNLFDVEKSAPVAVEVAPEVDGLGPVAAVVAAAVGIAVDRQKF